MMKCKVNPCVGETVNDTSEVKSHGGQISWRQETGELGPCLIQGGKDTVGVGKLSSRVRL